MAVNHLMTQVHREEIVSQKMVNLPDVIIAVLTFLL